MIDAEKRQIRREIVVKVNPVVVWETFTTKRGLESFMAATAEVEPRVGGKLLTQVPPDGPKLEAVFKVVEPARRLVYHEEPLPGQDAGTQVIEWTFEPAEAGGTRITLVHSGFGADFSTMVDGVYWAWGTLLRRLRWVLEEGYNHQNHPYFGFHGGLLGMFLRVWEVLPGTPAERAGLQPGDNIQRAGGLVLQGIDWPAEVFRHIRAGEPVELLVLRNWKPITITVTPDARPLGVGEGEAL